MRTILVLISCLWFAACDGPPELVEIVLVPCEIRKGVDGCATVVEFPDRSRRLRYGRWGAVGDTILAAKAGSANPGNWVSP